MPDRNLFKGLLSSEVTCDYPSPSTWIIKSKYCEKYEQFTQDEELGPSVTIAKFLVENKDNPNQHALMKVYMQMPDLGTEFDPPEERAEQVSDKSAGATFQTVRVLKLFTEKKSTVTPVLLALANIETTDMSSTSATISQWENIIPGVTGPIFSGIWQSFLASLGTSLLLTTEI